MDPSPTAAAAIANHLAGPSTAAAVLDSSSCLRYAASRSTEPPAAFAPSELRALLDGHNLRECDWVFGAIEESPLFCPRCVGGKVFVSPNFNEGKEGQREATMRRIGYLTRRGVFQGWLTESILDKDCY